MSAEDRIKLAEAMGWRQTLAGWVAPDGSHKRASIDRPYPPPDPFTDANDDYAVLEWMRKGGPNEAMDHLLFWHAQDYKIGNYARAALKVIA